MKITKIYFKKKFIVGAISKFNGLIFTFDFSKKNEPCLKCFYQDIPSDEILNCEQEGVMGPVAGVVGCIQSNEVLRKVLKIGKCENILRRKNNNKWLKNALKKSIYMKLFY